jgi:hypothetical protein
MGGMRFLTTAMCLLADAGEDSDSRFGRGPSPYTYDEVNFLWVPFIMLIVMALAWYIVTVLYKRQKQRPSNIPDEVP